jgi:hypothetical protein
MARATLSALARRGGAADGVVERRRRRRRLGRPRGVELRVVDAHGRGEHGLGRAHAALGASPPHVEAGQVGLRARELDGRVQAALDGRGGHVAVALRAREGVRGGDRHGVRARDAVEGLAHEQVEAQALVVGAVALGLVRGVGDGRLRGDATEVVELLRAAHGRERRRARRPVREVVGLRAADARQVELRAAHVFGRRVVRRALERLRRRAERWLPLRPRDARVGRRRRDARARREQRRLMGARERERLVERHRLHGRRRRRSRRAEERGA